MLRDRLTSLMYMLGIGVAIFLVVGAILSPIAAGSIALLVLVFWFRANKKLRPAVSSTRLSRRAFLLHARALRC